jgi:hypothetical protein
VHAVLPRAAFAVLVSIMATVAVAEAGVSPFWRPLGTSASGNGVSQTPSPRMAFDGSLAVGGDGRPVVAYTEHPNAVAAQGAITVKRWTGSAWQTLSGGSGIGQGYQPQVRISPTGAIVVAWLTDDEAGNSEIRLRVRTGSTFDALGGSDSPGGVSGTNPGITAPFSLALDAAGNPVVAFLAVATTGITEVTPTPEVIDDTAQVYVRRWTGSAWEFVGSDFSGGGASSARSFVNGTGNTVRHIADTPSLAIDSNGDPVVAFTYYTTLDDDPVANTDVYVTRWAGLAWVPVGDPVPAGDTPAGNGQAGGVSNSATGSFNPSLAPDAGGRLALAWEEDTPTGATYVWVRVWNGADTWAELAGSATDSGFALAETVNMLPQVAVDPDGNPVVAWQALVDFAAPSQVFVRRWNGAGAWEELGLDSASNAGISDALLDALAPSLALTPAGGTAEAGVPAVAWLDSRETGSSQVFLRQLFTGATVPLTVTLLGDGSMASEPIGVACATGTCVTQFPVGTVVTLLPLGGADTVFGAWAGACTGGGACTVTLSAPRSVNASFVAGATLAVGVLSEGGRVTSSPAGIAACTDACSAKFALGTLVTLTAAVNPGGTFTGWGDACAFRGTNTTCALPLDANASVTASFDLRAYALSVTAATPPGTGGYGAVGSIGGPFITCAFGGGACSTDIGHGTPVELVASAEPGNRFLRWTGGPCNGRTSLSCQFTLTANASTTALFRAVTDVQVLKAGNGSGTVKGTGFNCGPDCVEQVFTGTSRSLTAAPTTGSRFLGWSGDACDGQPSGACTVVAAGPNQSVTATFQLNRHRLAVTVTGTGTGFTTSDPGDIDCGAGHTTCAAEYDYGTLVRLTPFPDPDNMLASWSGCTSLNGSVCNVLLKANRTVTLRFAPAHTLAVTASGNGSGRIVTTTKPGLTCISNCSESQQFPLNAAVVLTPQPAAGTGFQWVGGACSGRASCRVVMSVNQSVAGQFTLNRHALTVASRPGGNVASLLPDGTFDCGSGGSACTGVFDYGTPVALQATPDEGFVFVRWTGIACAGGATNATCAFPLRANVTATPAFRARTLLTVVKAGTGAGTVSAPGISCGADCSEAVFDARTVKLTARPAVGSRFLDFAGACVSNTSTCTFLPAGDNQSVTATFELIPYTVTVADRPNGEVADLNALPDPVTCGAGQTDCTATLDFGTPVVLRAVPIPGTLFVKWTGTVCNGRTNATCEFRVPARDVALAPIYRDVTTLSLNKSGMGTVRSSPAGITCGPTCDAAAFDFARGALVRLTATPATGWSFDGFSGDCAGLACTVNASTVTAFVGASFTIQQRRLSVTVAGNGSVSGTGFFCDASATPCAQDFDYGTLLPLTPAPAAGHRFMGWAGSCTGANPATCRPLLTVNRSLTATFRPVFGLDVTRTGNSNSGGITSSPAGINCGVTTTDCAEDYLGGTKVTLTRKAPPAGTVFRWLGDCAFRGANATCALPMDANHSVVAEYRLQELGLTVNNAAPLSGTVSRVGGALDCGSACFEVIDYGTPVTLLATPASSPASEFVAWTGCTPATNLSCTFPLTANRTVTATFRPLVSSLALQSLLTGPLGVGGIRQLTALATFTDGSQQDVTAQATWSSNASTIATVNASGLVTGRTVLGQAGIVATFRGVTSTPLVVEVDTLVPDADVVAPRPRAIVVECTPYGERTVDASLLACLPSGLRYEVHCRATGRFAGDPDTDVDITDQVTWVSTSATIARSTGLVALTGPVRQSFRMNGAGTARLYAKLGSRTSLTTGTLGTDAWVVQGSPQTLTGPPQIQPAMPSVDVGGDPVQLRAMASFNPTAACPAPLPRDFSLLVDWASDDELVAEVSFFGAVTGVAPGTTNISATYGIMEPATVPLTVQSP